MQKLTAIIPTGNEAHNIEAAIDSVRFADEILVVDSFSTDNTIELARARGARVIQREYGNSASQKNWAIPQATHEWILLLDADERVTPELKAEIRGMLAGNLDQDGYWIPRRNFFMNREIRFSGWQGDKVVRFFHRDKCRYQEKNVHSEIEVRGTLGKLKGQLLHNTYVSYDHHIAKLNRYAEWQAGDYDSKTGRITAYHLWIKPAFRFFKHYVTGMGFRDGIPGFIIASSQAYAVRTRYIKLHILRNRGGKAEQNIHRLFRTRQQTGKTDS